VVVSLYMTMSRLRNRTGPLAVLQIVQSVGILAGTVALSGPLGLDAVGWSALVVELAMAAAVAVPTLRWLRSGQPVEPAAAR
jgi:O-antigen/teichoic acid export membrane protein